MVASNDNEQLKDAYSSYADVPLNPRVQTFGLTGVKVSSKFTHII